MTTASTPGAGATARLLAPALLAAAFAAATVTACDDGGPEHAAAASSTTPTATPALSPTSAATSTSPEELCTRIVAHWSRAMLDSDTYGDYQSMGLSNGQYDILRSVVDAARAVRKRQGVAAADKLIDRQAHKGCVDWYRSGGPGENPWH
ncbi:hypothetical protein OG802_08820 [Streptomyces sp. NBC_00704]|uniref:hypothetical protein n=1 Tax=Streptomyces sp. NBC_00704 TaxID=2975809 RepID=UPI002E30888E|nr:hypothetical protein [Streptomyces sp. NBC_00704]